MLYDDLSIKIEDKIYRQKLNSAYIDHFHVPSANNYPKNDIEFENMNVLFII